MTAEMTAAGIAAAPASPTQRAIEAVWRIEAARLIAGLTRLVGDVGRAEDLAQDALVVALERWPESGVPDNPGAWLMATAKYLAIDLLRRNTRLERKQEEIARDLGIQLAMDGADLDAELDDAIGDDLLSLIFTCCHPVLSTEARLALTLRLLGGLTTKEIARAFLVPEATLAQRIVRAKRTLTAARVPFEVPDGEALHERLASVLEVVYLIFNEGYAATAGDDWMRPALCEEALRLGRILAELAPREPEVHGLVALMEIQASRAAARRGPAGEPVLLLEQDRSRWDRILVRRGLAALERAERQLDGSRGGRSRADEPVQPRAPTSTRLDDSSRSARVGGKRASALGPYVLQAQIAACHARAATAAQTDWAQIAALYDALAQLTPSPVVELNRAVAYGMAFGPAAGLELVDALADEPSLAGYHLLPSVRGDLLAKLGRSAEARVEFERAAALTQNSQERKLLRERMRLIVGVSARAID
jgi:RNA polymerase sigma factor (sigma-70 family)